MWKVHTYSSRWPTESCLVWKWLMWLHLYTAGLSHAIIVKQNDMRSVLSPLFLKAMSIISFFPFLPHDAHIPPAILAIFFKTPHKLKFRADQIYTWRLLTINYRKSSCSGWPCCLSPRRRRRYVCASAQGDGALWVTPPTQSEDYLRSNHP